MTDQRADIVGEVSDDAFDHLRRQVECLAAEIARRDALSSAQVDAEIARAIETRINPILAAYALRERVEGNLPLH